MLGTLLLLCVGQFRSIRLMAVDKEKVAEESVTSRLFKIILSWDYFRLLKNSKV